LRQHPALRCPDFPRSATRAVTNDTAADRDHPACTVDCSPAFGNAVSSASSSASGLLAAIPCAQAFDPQQGRIALADANREYGRRFNRIFIVCATDKSAPEILEILQRRLNNDAEAELHEAAEQQRQITEIRLKKWLQE